MLTDYHVHLETGPYTLDWLKEYLDVAKSRGITDLGFSEHGYRFKQAKQLLFNPWVAERQTEDLEEYIKLIIQAKEQKLPVKLGIELDYLPGKEKEIEEFLKPYPWDYVIGSVHWLNDWGFDLDQMKDRWSDKKVIDIYTQYFSIVEEMIASKLFDILGHLDVIKVFGHKPDDSEKEKLLMIYDQLVSKLSSSEIAVELSTAGLRKPVNELYPSPDLMKRLVNRRVPLIINSDAHRPADVGADYPQGIKYLKDHGVKSIATFIDRKKAMFLLE